MVDANSAAAQSVSREKQRTPSLRHKAGSVGSVGSENMSSLRVVNVSPKSYQQPFPDTPIDELLDSPLSSPHEAADEVYIPRLRDPMSPIASPTPPSVFDIPEEDPVEGTAPTTALGSGRDSDDLDFNLKPPLPSVAPQNGLEHLSLRFFSVEHLDLILRDYAGLALRFTRFLDQYRPQHAEALKQYAQARKAIAAVEYANAVTSHLRPSPGPAPFVAATIDERFEAWSKHIVEDLVEEALPAYLTHRLVQLVTETLVKEITGSNAPLMHELIPSLAEVYCISDPSMPDNPIVYASEEFYNTTQYGKEHVIGRNCRFLQGPKTSPASVRRLIETLTNGEECCETILNYRRDGTPFMNLLLIAPLYDNKGTVRYFLGAQIDVSSLIENGRGLESFAQLLAQDRSFGGPLDRDPKQALGELGQLLDEEETEFLKERVQGRRSSMVSQLSRGPGTVRSGVSGARTTNSRGRGSRIILGMDEMVKEKSLWPNANLGSSGRLPGVYQNYLLVRPYPSLRITFTSPTLRIPGLLQTKLLDRIGGPSTVREGLLEALSRGTTGVTAKVTWLPSSTSDEGGGRPRWLHMTPLFGSDDRVGVWMVVIVEEEKVTGSLNRGGSVYGNGNGEVTGRPSTADKLTSSKLYADYLKREGASASGAARPLTGETQGTSSSTRERREVDDAFRDF